MKDYISFSEISNIMEQSKHAPFLCKLEEKYDNELYITIMGATVDDCVDLHKVDENTALDQTLTQSIEANPEQAFGIVFEDYIMYQVRNESFCSNDLEEIHSGKFINMFEKSKLLDYLTVSTDACQLADGTFDPSKWKHYGIYTQSHIIDVVSLDDPMIFLE